VCSSDLRGKDRWNGYLDGIPNAKPFSVVMKPQMLKMTFPA
jgi:hypothetical protein